ncbi:MAG: AAA family ATPase [Prevotella sp.]|nr:AAA family ATPase [Prevotella sp.]MBE6263554.1 AAA family ATPase [Prevotella sp.]
MIRGKKMKKPLRRLKIQEETETDLVPDFVDDGEELTLLTAINSIVTLAEDSALSNSFFEKADRFITYFSERQDITKIQAVLLALFIESSAAGNKSDFSDVARYLDCNNVQVLQYKGEVDELVRKGMLRMIKNNMNRSYDYAITQGFMENLAKNEPYQRKSYKNATGIQFFQYFYDITHLRHEDELSSELMLEEIGRLMDDNPDLSYVKALRGIGMSAASEAVVTHMCRHLVLCGTVNIPMSHLVFLFDEQHLKYDFDRAMSDGRHYLVRNGWVENAFSEGFREKDEYQLTTKSREILLQEFEIKQTDCNKGCDVIQSDGIAEKDLFFNNEVKHQLDGLAELLDESHYLSICDRLKEKGHRQGFACLFYGAPGTGKTESVLQLAKKTDRDIMQVNISQVKSMWVGESEKNIKAIFDRYRAVAKNSKRVPILLFNEADAVIGKRKEGAERSVDKMENSIQNIILQEMESLDGIMIATTNLVQNMDAAFERRFLYKVKFEKPELAQRTKIWQSMMPELSEKTAERLASAYDFSGGQIENITRKCDIESILYGDEFVTDEKIEQYCREENIVKTRATRIGFQ